MEVTKEYLVEKIAQYKKLAETLRNDSIANSGAAQALEKILKEIEVG